jgi:hypothetical protein
MRAVGAVYVSLMLASVQARPFRRKGCFFVLKYDGYRLLAELSG